MTAPSSSAEQTAGSLLARYEPVIGLEVHCQLRTRSKLFCGCATTFGAPPNHHVCPICLGLPGVLPVLNRQAVDYAVAMALAMNATIASTSVFARKQYFYPDLPKNYQLTQFEQPYCRGGGLTLASGAHIRLQRIHLEEDAGKNIHAPEASFVDLNRAGTPLIEIVSEPDLRSPADAADYLRKLRALVRALQISDGNLEEGSFRCDANVSLRLRGRQGLGTRCEIKNLNSFRNIEKAITYEILRQADVLDAGERVEQLSLLWDAAAGRTRTMRRKGEGEDYRYFADPDLPPLRISDERIRRIAASLPELPEAKAQRYVTELGLHADQANFLTQDDDLGAYFAALVDSLSGAVEAKTIANWLTSDFMYAAHTHDWNLAQPPIAVPAVAELLLMVSRGAISAKIAKQVWQDMVASGAAASTIVARDGLAQVSDPQAIAAVVSEVLEAYPQQVADYLAGKEKILAFLVGALMRASRGRFNPGLANQLLKEQLHARKPPVQPQ